MIRTLLVPLDGSRFGEHALPLALTIARRSQARIHLVHAHHRLDTPYAEMVVFDENLDRQMRSQEEAYLARTAADVSKAYSGLVTTALEEGHSATVIKHQAEAVKADLIVMTTHARGPLARFWLGSVTDELIREAPVPLLLAHPQEALPDLAKDVPLQHWLIPLEGSPLSEHILDYATELGRFVAADFTFLRVLRPVTPVYIPEEIGTFGSVPDDMMQRVESLQDQVKRDAVAYLDKVAAPLRANNLKVTATVAVDEQPGVAILDHAKTGVHAIALGSHGRHGLSRLLLGSTADYVIRGSSVPVLVHRKIV